MNQIFVIDDEPAMGENIERMLRSLDAHVTTFQDPRVALDQALKHPPELVLLDVRMPGMSGEEVFTRLHQAHPGLRIVFLTAFGSVEGAVLAMRKGAFDYLQKPFNRDDLLLVVQRALAAVSLESEVKSLRDQLGALDGTELRSRSAPMQAQIDKCIRAAPTDATIMILGESGSGKEVLARFIHANSKRKVGPFVAVDCSSMPATLIESELFGHEKGAFTGADRAKKGLIEAAHTGTLFLDEIGDLPTELQTRLFRFVEEREVRRLGGVERLRVDCRILCATNQDLAAKLKDGSFREELFYRLGVVIIKVPPMRDRPEDIAPLARSFLDFFCSRYGKHLTASSAFFQELARRPWPGNVRQLKNVIEGLTALSSEGQLEPDDLTEQEDVPQTPLSLSELPWKEAREKHMANFEASYARAVLARCNGNLSAAAREAGVDRKTFYQLLRRHDSAQPEFGQ